MAKKSTTVFLVFVILWEIAVGLLYGFFIRYNTDAFTKMDTNPITLIYKLATSPTTSSDVVVDSTQLPYPYIVVAIAIVLLIVGNFIFEFRFGYGGRIYREINCDWNGFHSLDLRFYRSKLLHLQNILE